jgi:hypothetical protein
MFLKDFFLPPQDLLRRFSTGARKKQPGSINRLLFNFFVLLLSKYNLTLKLYFTTSFSRCIRSQPQVRVQQLDQRT